MNRLALGIARAHTIQCPTHGVPLGAYRRAPY